LYKEDAVEAMAYSRVRQELAKTLDRVCKDHAPVIVTRQSQKHSSVVIISLEDYEAMEETAYLLRSSRNARRLMESVVQLGEGRGKKRSLTE
jgi:antitoxin YefM